MRRAIAVSVLVVVPLACACAPQQAGSEHAASHASASGPVSAMAALSTAASSLSVGPQTSMAIYETRTATPAAPTGAHAHPPDTPCVYPVDESPQPWDPGFLGVLQESDLVIEADVEDRFQKLTQVGDQVFWSQLIDNVDVVRSRVAPPPIVTGLSVQGAPGQPPYAWAPGRYVLLLLAVANGVSSAADGTSGMFRIVDGRALRFCPNYDDPAHPIAASGMPPTVNELLALIPTQLPADNVAPKPTTAFSP